MSLNEHSFTSVSLPVTEEAETLYHLGEKKTQNLILLDADLCTIHTVMAPQPNSLSPPVASYTINFEQEMCQNRKLCTVGGTTLQREY